MSDDRSERLRQRRQESKQKAEQSAAPETSEPSDSEEESESVKEEFVGTYMYLPESLKQELGPTFKILSAEYERKFGEELEKNRHFYPVVVQYGLDGLAGLDASEVRDRLEELDLVSPADD